ncbi:hypothetical protein CPB83DRAFT_409433 [Crepidotus variabilis]|uniref:DUF8021 domain-containing protein n=1 Tax=Crepidotus variabilis TaxID=179855 RepID=A0A9P6ES17_9AGAR|nr:hypothetical protein CPB83DRAFT_409433 [Crepidotus variabilis]
MFRRLFILASIASLIAPSMAACDYTQLQSLTSTYVASQAAGQQLPSTITTADTKYTENFQSATLQSSILTQPLKIDHNRSLHDTVACATFTELIVTDKKHPYVIGTQIRLSDDGSVVKSIDTLVTDTGDWAFNATGTLYWSTQEDTKSGWATIPVEKRDTRATIQAAADAYLDLFHDPKVVVPWGTPCARLEGGAYTGRGAPTDSCNLGVPSNVQIVNRRYVVDETVGSVDIFLNFGGNNGNPDSHNFRVDGGKLRYIHTITVGQIQV